MEIVRLADGDYFEYEALLLKRDALECDAQQYMNEYVRVFGELITECFRENVRCIELKKSIAFCQAAVNCGRDVSEVELELFIGEEMKLYYDELEQMAKDNELCQKFEEIPEYKVRKIKKIYRELAKQLHPDISPLTAQFPELDELWNRAVIAYKCNSLDEIEEVKLLVNAFLERNGIEHADVFIPDINEKILKLKAEIERIRTTDPYTYKFLLEDSELVEDKKNSLRKETEEYKDYAARLTEILNCLLGTE